MTTYINGRASDAQGGGTNTIGSGSMSDTARVIDIGSQGDDAQSLNGTVSDIIIWHTLLTADEARQVYALGSTFNPRLNINAYRKGHAVMHWWPLKDILSGDDSIGQDQITEKGFTHHTAPTSDAVAPEVAVRGAFRGDGPNDITTSDTA